VVTSPGRLHYELTIKISVRPMVGRAFEGFFYREAGGPPTRGRALCSGIPWKREAHIVPDFFLIPLLRRSIATSSRRIHAGCFCQSDMPARSNFTLTRSNRKSAGRHRPAFTEVIWRPWHLR